MITARSLIIFVISIGFIAPLPVSAASEIQINEDSLVTDARRPSISGSSEDVKKVKVYVYKEGSEKAIYKSRATRVKKDGSWRVKIGKTLPDGAYDIRVTGSGAEEEETLVIGESASSARVDSALVVSRIPLLTGGTVRLGATVPVAYLQVSNTGKDTVHLTGFSVTQNGTAPESVVSMFSTADDTGLLRTSVSATFKNDAAFVPASAVFAPGQMRLFTIKATVSPFVGMHVGKNLMLDVVSVSTDGEVHAAFPIRGTTWTILY